MSTSIELVRLDGISKSFPGVLANDDVSLDLRVGEIHTILGENGAGKTTLMGVLCGLYRPDAGTIFIRGEPRVIHHPRDALQAGIGYVQQHCSLIPTLTVAQNLVLALQSSQQPTTLSKAATLVRDLSKRYGLEAPVMDLATGRRNRVPVAQLVRRTLRDLEPHAPELGSERELEGIRDILARGNGADRQLRVFNANRDIVEVVREIAVATEAALTAAS